MSFIGPRAEWDELSERYGKTIPYYNLRHAIKPGVTGWAQVNYPYGASLEDAVEKLKYDFYYLKHYSWFLVHRIINSALFFGNLSSPCVPSDLPG